MRLQIKQWGNSLALRIPKAFAESIGLHNDSPVEVSLEEGQLVIRPAAPALALETLLAQITDDNRHGEVATGPATGQEAW